METNYVVILDFSTETVIKIHLSKEQIEESYKYDDFEEFLFTLEPKYGFQVKDCCWMMCETLKEENYP
ncbi:hypothetical protein [Prevotella sp.]|uniref:hypothetical protein n=1 Tax=Prevotella sp. TaxID=59823 RepID=UPI001CAC60A1|nr:hypothetical protein [Prevotella sp.]MBF1580614.1 hypothetical protein [Prevotella sp.]